MPKCKPPKLDLDQQLINAVENADVSSVKSLLEKGASPNAEKRDTSQHSHTIFSALYLSISLNNPEIVAALLDAGANPMKGYTYQSIGRFGGRRSHSDCLEKAIDNEDTNVITLIIKSNQCSMAEIEKAQNFAKSNNKSSVFGALLLSKESWAMDVDDELTCVSIKPSLVLEVKENFDFLNEERLTVTRNLYTDKETSFKERFNDISRKALENACDKFVQLGGKLDKKTILTNASSLQSLNKSGFKLKTDK